MVAMDKILPPYKASFSVSNAVVMALSECCFKVGRLSCIANQREGKESAAEEAKAYCRLIDVKLTPSQARALYTLENISAHPIASSTASLFYKSAKMDPYSDEFIKMFEVSVFGDDVPNRLSRKVAGYDYPIPSHPKIKELLSGMFRFLKQAKGKVHPLLLSGVLLFMIPAIMPYSSHTFLLSCLYAKGMLCSYRKELSSILLLSKLEKSEKLLKDAISRSVEKGDMSPFLIEYLQTIGDAIDFECRQSLRARGGLTNQAKRMISLMEEGRFYSASELLSLLGLKSRLGLHKNYLKPALEEGAIEMSNPLSPTDRTQRYRRKAK